MPSRSSTIFKCKMDYTGKFGLTSIQKCMTAMRMLAYGAPGDLLDDYGRMAESTTIECFYKFCWRWWQCLDRNT